MPPKAICEPNTCFPVGELKGLWRLEIFENGSAVDIVELWDRLKGFTTVGIEKHEFGRLRNLERPRRAALMRIGIMNE